MRIFIKGLVTLTPDAEEVAAFQKKVDLFVYMYIYIYICICMHIYA